MTNHVDEGNMSIAMTAMANSFGQAASRLTGRYDQLAADAASMWSIAMTTPTQHAALALRTAQEAGAGRTRAETNNPENTAAPRGN